MKRLSLTVRMSLMFMSAVIAVLTVAGLSFNILSQHHFVTLDRQILLEKLESTKRILESKRNSENLSEELPQLQALLGAHQDMAATILAGDGSVLFSDSKAANIPERYRVSATRSMWEWQDGEHMYRGMTEKISIPGQADPLTALLILDVTTHTHFFETLLRWFWIGLLISSIASVALGWMVARRGLAPLQQITQVVASMSARSLKERIPLESVPPELQQLVASFNAMLARLDDAFARLSNFSADIAHELRTPVSNLMTHTEVVLTKKRNIEDYQENLCSNLEDLKRMSRMIDDMLFLAKSDNGLITPENACIELKELVTKLVEYYHLLADEAGITITVSGSGIISGDRLMLDRAISNLLSNALRYTPAGERISVKIRTSGEAVSLTVENPGEVISPDHLDKLFDRFYRADPARREGSPSNVGLGLAITRSIVEAHKGKIWCTSENGITAFHIEFLLQNQSS
ncbi:MULTISPECIES: heavy metal sensor histidine kinase [unclassified Pseudomonas]|uniref:heavy metal sensor histidine kinase n=1 Tax=unclassified Pseudomonas TaxID=196821 RepID=UPI00191865E1|nr:MULTISPECIES: heavy metal sensor histidine kinase [unclassified Pseudomonas]WPP46084.1 heavy metal sensor histidine kinase [Pseudomonas sp. AN-1]